MGHKVTYFSNFTPYRHVLDDTSAWGLSSSTSLSVRRYPELGESLQYRRFTVVAVQGNLNVHVFPS